MTTKISKSQTVAYSHEKGKMEGLAEGRELGLAEGRELGVAEGRELGVAEGEAKSKRETARKMLSMGMDKDTILQVTDLTEEELSALGDR